MRYFEHAFRGEIRHLFDVTHDDHLLTIMGTPSGMVIDWLEEAGYDPDDLCVSLINNRTYIVARDADLAFNFRMRFG